MAMTAIGFDDETAPRVSDELFHNSHTSCKTKTNADLKDNFKSLSAIPKTSGGVKFTPKQKDCVYAYTNWVKDMYRMGRDPSTVAFPIDNVTEIIEKSKAHEAYISRYETVSAAAKPQPFTKDMKWEDWAPSFLNYLRCIPGRNGVPLIYITRETDEPDPEPKSDFLEEYIANAPVSGNDFTSDADQVHVYLVNLICQHEEAESIIKVLEFHRDGRKDWKALKMHFEGQGLYSADINRAEKDLKTLFYAGEKRPHMWWLEFERRLNLAFATYNKHERRVVHSDNMKLRILLDKVTCDWLDTIKASISIELTRVPMTYTYQQAMIAFKTAVNKKFPPGSSTRTTKRTIQELDRGRGSQGHGRGSGRGRGFGGRGRGRGRGGRGGNQRRAYWNPHTNPHKDAKMITLRNGKRIEYHAAYDFPIELYNQFTDEQVSTLKRERREYREKNKRNYDDSTRRSVQELQAQMDEFRSDIMSVMSNSSGNSNRVPSSIRGGASASISQISGSIMGGRNEQQRKRMRHQDEYGNSDGTDR